jgi:phosphoglycerate kinase
VTKASVRDLDVKGKRVFVRVDLNVPRTRDGRITSDARIRGALPTIKLLCEKGASRVVLASHLGKPKGKPDDSMSLAPIATRLSELLGREVLMAPDCIGADTEKLVADAEDGAVILLENLRFHPFEQRNTGDFVRGLSRLGDCYVNDAFGTCHRFHASTIGVPMRFDRPAAGLLVEKEIAFLGKVVESPDKPFIAVIGGAKVSDKAGVVHRLLPKVDRLLVGGGAVFSFLRGRGASIGRSIIETDVPLDVQDITSPKLLLPVDLVAAPSPREPDKAHPVLALEIPPEEMGLDIGPQAAGAFAAEIEKAKTVVWAGPMGVFENEAFAKGTEAVARAIVRATERGATTVVGGGDTAAALDKYGLADKVSHASTGGSACLKFLEGKPLPGIEALAGAS